MTAEEREPQVVWRLRVMAAVLFLTALAFSQAPGLIVPDTKLDLTENPTAFLARAMSLWDGSAAFGQLQNQAYGYLFPIGPFHLVLVELGLPAWIVQRLWWSVILTTAFVGMWRLTAAMRVGGDWSRFAAALLFAVSPRFMSEVGVTSVEVWPLAMAPWVLLPLVDPRPRSWLGRVTRSALAVALVGGVNAVASGVVLVLPFLWLLTRRPLRPHLVVLGGWLLAVAAAILWWLGPLILLGRYSPPFLDWIENAAVTTNFAAPFEALRGTTPWLNYLMESGGPSWPAGWQLVTQPILIVITAFVAGLGLAGLSRTPVRVRGFLAVALLVGVGLVTMGFVGVGGSPLAPTLGNALDGVAAPLRNTHKFEPVIRVVVSVGLAQALWELHRVGERARALPFVVPTLSVALVLGLAAPAVAGSLPRAEGYSAIPQYWRDAADYLDGRTEPGTVLVTPGTSFADFVWGSTKDDPLQALMARPFVTRDAVPLGSAGATRFLDAVEARLRNGDGGDGFRESLAGAGIRFVLVRHDLRPDVVDNVTLRVHETLQESGLSVTQEFGPPMFNPGETAERTVDYRTRLPFAAIVIYEVVDAAPAQTVPAEGAVAAPSAGPEDVLDIRDAWSAPAVLTGTDAAALGGAERGIRPVVVDGNQRREAFFGRSQDPYSQVLTNDDPLRTGREVWTYVADAEAPTTKRIWTGDLLNVSASSSAADANATLRRGPASGPAASVDGDTGTSWISGRFGAGDGEWLELTFSRPVDLSGMSVTIADPPFGPRVTGVVVESDGGRTESAVAPSGSSVLNTPPGWTSRVRITADRFDGSGASVFTLAEVTIPSAAVGTALEVPVTMSGNTPVLFRVATPGSSDCSFVNGRMICAPVLGRTAESESGIRRLVSAEDAELRRLQGVVDIVPGSALESLLDGVTVVDASASSRGIGSPAGRPAVVMDDRLDTAWVAGERDRRPWIDLVFPEPVTTDRAQFLLDEFVAAARAKEIVLSFDDGPAVRTQVSQDGWARWSKRTFSELRITVAGTWGARNIDGASGFETDLPVGMSEIRFAGVTLPRPALDGASRTGVPCGFGPELRLGDARIPTRVTGTIADITEGHPLSWTSCGPLPPVDGSVLIEAMRSAEFAPRSLTMGTPPARTGSDSLRVTGSSRLTFHRSGSSEGMRFVALPQNFSAGWVARDSDGGMLQPVRVDGWKQGWILPDGVALAEARFEPNTTYRILLLVGAASLLVLALVGASPAARRASRHGLQRHEGYAGLVTWSPLVVSLALLGGLPGVLGGVAGVAARTVRRAWLRALTPLALLTAAGGLAALSAWPGGSSGFESGAVQVLAFAAIASAVLDTSRVGPRKRRSRGRSTKR